MSHGRRIAAIGGELSAPRSIRRGVLRCAAGPGVAGLAAGPGLAGLAAGFLAGRSVTPAAASERAKPRDQGPRSGLKFRL